MLSSLPALSSHPHPSFALSAAARPGGRRNERWFVPLGVAGLRDSKTQSSRLGFHTINDCTSGNKKYWSGFARRCRDWDGEESDFALEAEILEFMSCSEKPEAFPTRKELINGDRMDLVDAILKKRGWMSFGWDSDDEEEDEITVCGFDEANGWSSWEEDYRSSSMASSCPCDIDYSHSPSSSGRPLEMETSESGIDGILNRLDKERNLSFGFDSCNVADNALALSNDRNKDFSSKSLINGKVAGLFKSREPSSSSSPEKTVFDNSTRRLNQNPSLSEPGSWRSWSIQRAGVSDIDSKGFRINGIKNAEASDEPSGKGDNLDLKKPDEVTHNRIRSRLRNLELKLSTVLHSVRTNNNDEIVSRKNHESTSDEIQNLTDAWELQQNEIMNARDKLRSTRAKIAVFEGKMALALIEAQKIVEQKQRRVDDARRALRLLRSTSIVWPNSASEVLLAGSFDGWASKRKMEKSRRGIFSLGLQLYPGKYEIKFIVDGEWRIDPLRPTIKNNGFENNLLIVT